MIFENVKFDGEYTTICIEFITYKRSIGYKYDSRQVYAVKYLCDYLSKNFNGSIELTKESVNGYIAKRDGESQTTQTHRIQMIRQFGNYIKSIGYDAYTPPFKTVKRDKSFVPHIFTKDEIRGILAQADSLKPANKISKSHLIYPVIIRLLFNCGLRISEAINLKLTDFDMKTGVMHIKKSKFNSGRLVVLNENLHKKCLQYCEATGYSKEKDSYFFETKFNSKYTKGTIYKQFRTFLKNAEIVHGGRGKGPRLHDMRHTYAVYALDKMVKQGMDIYCALPILSVYLGHRTIESTEKYVRLVPAFHTDIINTMTPSYKDLFPEVKSLEEY